MDISRKKPPYPITPALRQYLRAYDRDTQLPVTYADLRQFTGSFPLLDRAGKDTLWQTVFFEPQMLRELGQGLIEVYALLKTAGDLSFSEHLVANKVDLDSKAYFGLNLTLDGKAEVFTGPHADVANPMLTREYRKPFVVPSEKDI